MKRTVLFLTVVVAIFGATGAQAGAHVGVNVDWNKFKNSGSGDWGLGGRLAFGGAGVDLTTGFDYYFVDAGSFFKDTSDKSGLDLKFWELFENVTYTFPSPGVSPYLGAGIDYSRRSFDEVFSGFFDNTKNRVGFNVLGGVKFGAPFIEVRGTFYSGTAFNDRFVITGGVLF